MICSYLSSTAKYRLVVHFETFIASTFDLKPFSSTDKDFTKKQVGSTCYAVVPDVVEALVKSLEF